MSEERMWEFDSETELCAPSKWLSFRFITILRVNVNGWNKKFSHGNSTLISRRKQKKFLITKKHKKFMDKSPKTKSPQQEPSDVKVNPNLVIKIVMKKMDGSDHDTNNNDGVVKVKKESSAKEFCKSFFNLSSSSSSSGDRNNNSSQQQVPTTNQYTKVTVDGLMSHLNLQQNRLQTNVIHNSEINKRWVITRLQTVAWRHFYSPAWVIIVAEIFHELKKHSRKHIFVILKRELFAFPKERNFPRKNKRHSIFLFCVCRFSGNLRIDFIERQSFVAKSKKKK